MLADHVRIYCFANWIIMITPNSMGFLVVKALNAPGSKWQPAPLLDEEITDYEDQRW